MRLPFFLWTGIILARAVVVGEQDFIHGAEFQQMLLELAEGEHILDSAKVEHSATRSEGRLGTVRPRFPSARSDGNDDEYDGYDSGRQSAVKVQPPLAAEVLFDRAVWRGESGSSSELDDDDRREVSSGVQSQGRASEASAAGDQGVSHSEEDDVDHDLLSQTTDQPTMSTFSRTKFATLPPFFPTRTVTVYRDTFPYSGVVIGSAVAGSVVLVSGVGLAVFFALNEGENPEVRQQEREWEDRQRDPEWLADFDL